MFFNFSEPLFFLTYEMDLKWNLLHNVIEVIQWDKTWRMTDTDQDLVSVRWYYVMVIDYY